MSDCNGNEETRLNLAVAFRALDKLGFNEGIDNNISVIAPAKQGTGEIMLINPYGLNWREIRVSSLIGVDDQGNVVEGNGKPSAAAVAVHRGLRQTKPNSRCVMHTHMPYATTLGILEDPTIKLYHQNSARVYGKVAYLQEYTGLLTTVKDGRELGKILGDCDALMMPNHGALACGVNVAAAVDLMYYLERACMFQIMAYATGQPLRQFPASVADRLQSQYSGTQGLADAECHFAAIKRQVINDTPDVQW